MKIKYIAEARSRGYLKVCVSTSLGDKVYTVSETCYSRLSSPMCGDEIDEDTLSALSHEDEYYRATKKALSVLQYGDNSQRRLYMKLCESGFSKDCSSRVVSDMISLGYISEERQLGRLISQEVEKKRTGYALIQKKLMNRGYSRNMIREVYEALIQNGEIDPIGARESIIEEAREAGATDEEIRALLYKRGYGTC